MYTYYTLHTHYIHYSVCFINTTITMCRYVYSTVCVLQVRVYIDSVYLKNTSK